MKKRKKTENVSFSAIFQEVRESRTSWLKSSRKKYLCDFLGRGTRETIAFDHLCPSESVVSVPSRLNTITAPVWLNEICTLTKLRFGIFFVQFFHPHYNLIKTDSDIGERNPWVTSTRINRERGGQISSPQL